MNCVRLENNTQMHLESYENLQGFNVLFVPNICSWDWCLEFMKLLKRFYVRLDVEWSNTHCKGSQKKHVWCKYGNSKPQRFTN